MVLLEVVVVMIAVVFVLHHDEPSKEHLYRLMEVARSIAAMQNSHVEIRILHDHVGCRPSSELGHAQRSLGQIAVVYQVIVVSAWLVVPSVAPLDA